MKWLTQLSTVFLSRNILSRTWPAILLRFLDHTHTYIHTKLIGLLLASDQPRRSSRYLHNTQTPETKSMLSPRFKPAIPSNSGMAELLDGMATPTSAKRINPLNMKAVCFI